MGDKEWQGLVWRSGIALAMCCFLSVLLSCLFVFLSVSCCKRFGILAVLLSCLSFCYNLGGKDFRRVAASLRIVAAIWHSFSFRLCLFPQDVSAAGALSCLFVSHAVTTAGDDVVLRVATQFWGFVVACQSFSSCIVFSCFPSVSFALSAWASLACVFSYSATALGNKGALGVATSLWRFFVS